MGDWILIERHELDTIWMPRSYFLGPNIGSWSQYNYIVCALNTWCGGGFGEITNANSLALNKNESFIPWSTFVYYFLYLVFYMCLSVINHALSEGLFFLHNFCNAGSDVRDVFSKESLPGIFCHSQRLVFCIGICLPCEMMVSRQVEEDDIS